MKRKAPEWKRTRWAIQFSNSRDDCMLLGSLWDHAERARSGHVGEPPRALLFCTRAQARAWCASQRTKYTDYSKGHICRAWRFRPVRVRETVRVIP